MKNAKRKIISLLVASALLAMAVVGGTLAYLTDSEEATNTFTVGSVDIDLLESKLHRVNAGTTTAGRLSTDEVTMEGAAGTAPDDSHGWAGAYFTDEQIEADAAEYANYLADKGDGMLPGDNVMKCPYVKNVGASDAFIRIRVLVPAVLDNGILGNSMYTGTAITSGAATLAVTNDKEVDGKLYNEYAFTFADALEPDAMTFWNPWADIKISENTTSEQLEALIANGDIDPNDNSFGVLVQADAIQASGFDDAAAAFAAFDAQP